MKMEMEMEMKMKIEMRWKETTRVPSRPLAQVVAYPSLSYPLSLILIDDGIREISLTSELRTNQKPLLPEIYEMYLKMYLKIHTLDHMTPRRISSLANALAICASSSLYIYIYIYIYKCKYIH